MILEGTRDPLFLDRFPDAHDDSLDTLVPDPSAAAVAGAAARAADCFFAGGLVIVPLGDCTCPGTIEGR